MNFFKIFNKHKEQGEQSFAFTFNLMLLFRISDFGLCIPLKTEVRILSQFFVT